LHWFALHSEVDVRHAEEGVTVIQDYLSFHQASDDLFEQIASLTLGENLSLATTFQLVRNNGPALTRVPLGRGISRP
jgi:hypothetical protein